MNVVNEYLTTSSGFKMPAMGLGTWQSRGALLENALEAALNCGYRYIDTSYMYQNETVIGKVVKRWIDEGRLNRKDIFISTKLPNFVRRPDQVRSLLLSQLKRLKLDYVDLYLLHFPIGVNYNHYIKYKDVTFDQDTNALEIWREIENMVQEGFIKHLGLSNVNRQYIDSVLKKVRIKPVNIQIETHPFYPQTELISYCREKGLSVTAICPLGSPGFNDYFRLNEMQVQTFNQVYDNIKIQRLASDLSMTQAQLLLKYSLDRGLAVIPKSVTPTRIKENFHALSLDRLSNATMQELNELCEGEFSQILRRKDWIPLPIVPTYARNQIYPVYSGINNNANRACSHHLLRFCPSPPRHDFDYYTPDNRNLEDYFTRYMKLRGIIADLRLEVYPPNRIHIHYFQVNHPNGLKPEFYEFHLPEYYNIDDIVACVMSSGLLKITTKRTYEEETEEVPIYAPDEDDESN